MNWLTILLGHPKTEESNDPVLEAEKYLGDRDMHAGTMTTLKKSARAVRIAAGLRPRPSFKRDRRAQMKAMQMHRILEAGKASAPTRPHAVRIKTDNIVGYIEHREKIDPRNGRTMVMMPTPIYETVHVDRSRYTGEKLRELRRTRR